MNSEYGLSNDNSDTVLNSEYGLVNDNSCTVWNSEYGLSNDNSDTVLNSEYGLLHFLPIHNNIIPPLLEMGANNKNYS